MFSIGITTFKRRLGMVEKLVHQIKEYRPDVEIILAVNADYKEPFDNAYRKSILNLCAEYDDIYPVIFPQFTGLSKMWNTIILNASEEFILVMNDDLELSGDVFADIDKRINDICDKHRTSGEIFTINNSFSYYVCSKRIIDELGYFDERLLAFGEEDGDIVWRYIKKYHKSIDNLKIEGIKNQAEGYLIAHPNMEVANVHGRRLVPKFNRNFIMEEKYVRNLFGIRGMFEHKMSQKIEDAVQYPYEKFKREHFGSL